MMNRINTISISAITLALAAVTFGGNILSADVGLLQRVQTLETIIERTQAPVGAIVAWHKDLVGTQTLPPGWVESNGQVIDDTESVLNGKHVPNLNRGLFIRGGSNSGIEQTQDWKSMSILSAQETGVNYTHELPSIPKSGRNPKGFFGGYWKNSSANKLFFEYDDSEVRPMNVSMVWIIRVK